MADRTTAWRDPGAPLPAAGDEDACRVHWDRWREAARNNADAATGGFAEAAPDDPAAAPLLTAIFGNSPYLSRGLIADQTFARVLIEDGPDVACAAAEAALDGGPEAESTDDLMERLRTAKRRAALAIALADIASVWPLEATTAALSRIAESALRATCGHLLRQRHEAGDLALPAPDTPERGSGLIVLGMGKLGARELNYSSDIDLIVLYDDDTAPLAGDSGPQALFNRLARHLVRVMSELTAHGYVFRTDLRLRPDPASTPLALSVRAARVYYETAGRNWERAAMIKARPVSGDMEAGEAFLDALRPFVWRRRLDFAAVQDIQTVKRQIDAARGGGEIATAGHNVKLGRGGIREIEFFVQAQQLLWGGRNRDLRPRGTLAALEALVAAGHLTGGAAAELRAAYEFHRRLEHRLQMVNDAQTHSLPADDTGMARIAAFFAFRSTAAFSDALLARLRTVERHYAALFARDTDAADAGDLAFSADAEDDPGTLAALADAGYGEPPRAAATVRAWLAGRYPATRDARARELVSELAPAIVRAFAAAADPDAALRRFDAFLARLPAGVRLLSLFAAHPALLGLVAEIVGSAPRLADRLARRPDLLDGALSRDFADLDVPDDADLDEGVAEAARRGLVRLFYAREFGADEMRAELAAASREADGIEDLMRAQRHWTGERTFQIDVHVLRGLLTPVEAAGPLSAIADACLAALLPAVADAFAARHGRIPGGETALVALGDLGSREMAADSALDLLLVYDHPADAEESDGEAPLPPGRYYAGLCRRLVAAVAAPTAEGALYALDMSPRPSGTAGPVACSLPAFVERHGAGAATWERQALTRARVVCAGGGLGERFDAAKRAALARPCDPRALAADILDSRERARPGRGDAAAGSIAHRPGGLLDVEALAGFLQLRHAAETPEILAGDAVSVFEAAGAGALIDADAARELADAARLWRNLQGILRLTAGADAVDENATGMVRDVVGRSSGRIVFDALVQSIEETATRAAAHFDRLLAPPGA